MAISACKTGWLFYCCLAVAVLAGSSLKSIAQVNRQTINVKTLGAKADGQTDDGAVLQKALNQGGSRSITYIKIPSGTYLINNPGNGRGQAGFYGLKIRSNTILQLDRGARFLFTGHGAILSNFVKEPIRNIAIIGGEFMSSSGVKGKWKQGDDGIFLSNATNVVIRNIHCNRIADRGIIFNGTCRDIKILDNEISDTYNAGVSLNQNTVQNVVIQGNYVHDIGGDGILINGDASRISGNRIQDVGFWAGKPYGSGIALGTDNRSCTSDTIEGNLIKNVGAFGIISNNCLRSILRNNTINSCRMAGIKIGAGSKASTVSDNRIDDAGSADWDNTMYGKSGIILQGAGSIVENNELDQVTGNGIYIDRYSTGASVLNNKVKELRAQGRIENNAIVIDADNIKLRNNQLNNTVGYGILLGKRFAPGGIVLDNNRSNNPMLKIRMRSGVQYQRGKSPSSIKIETVK